MGLSAKLFPVPNMSTPSAKEKFSPPASNTRSSFKKPKTTTENDMEQDSATAFESEKIFIEQTDTFQSFGTFDAPDPSSWDDQVEREKLRLASLKNNDMAVDDVVDKGKQQETDNYTTSFEKEILPTPGTANSSSTAAAPKPVTQFTKIPKQTRFFAFTPFIAEKGDIIQKGDDAKKGNPIQKRAETISLYMTPKNGFLGAKADYFRKCYTVFFDSETNLEKAINAGVPIKDLDNITFTPKNSKIARVEEIDKTIRVTDIPLFIKSEAVKQFFSKFGIIQRFSMIHRGAFQTAYIVYSNSTNIIKLYDEIWSVDMFDFAVRIYPLGLTEDQLETRHKFAIRLIGLPPNTTYGDLKPIVYATGAKATHHPRSADPSYRNKNFIYLFFETENDLNRARDQHFNVNNKAVFWQVVEERKCNICASKEHIAKQCPNNTRIFRNTYHSLYEKFRPAQYRPIQSNNARQQSFTQFETPKESYSNVASTSHGSNLSNANNISMHDASVTQLSLNSATDKQLTAKIEPIIKKAIFEERKVFNESIVRNRNYSTKKIEELSVLLKDVKVDMKKTNLEISTFGSRLKEVENYMTNHEDRLTQVEAAIVTIQHNQKEMFEQTLATTKSSNLINFDDNNTRLSATTSTSPANAAIADLRNKYETVTNSQTVLDSKLDKIMSVVMSLAPSST